MTSSPASQLLWQPTYCDEGEGQAKFITTLANSSLMESHRRARGVVPHIEITFELDANSILAIGYWTGNVSLFVPSLSLQSRLAYSGKSGSFVITKDRGSLSRRT